MPDAVTPVTATIAAAGVILGGIAAALASSYAAKQRIREVEITYIQKLKDTYLVNARLYTNSVYVPLNKAISELLDHYFEFRLHIDTKTRGTSDQALARFHKACAAFDRRVDELMDQGADAFITTALEERLRAFRSFLKSSQDATEARVKFVYEYSFVFPSILTFPFRPMNSVFSRRITRELQAEKGSFLGWKKLQFSVGLLGSRISGLVQELVEAPLTSAEFEERIITDTSDLKFLIKEVTLGAQQPNI